MNRIQFLKRIAGALGFAAIGAKVVADDVKSEPWPDPKLMKYDGISTVHVNGVEVKLGDTITIEGVTDASGKLKTFPFAGDAKRMKENQREMNLHTSALLNALNQS